MRNIIIDQQFDNFECIDIQQCISFDIIREDEREFIRFERNKTKFSLYDKSCLVT